MQCDHSAASSSLAKTCARSRCPALVSASNNECRGRGCRGVGRFCIVQHVNDKCILLAGEAGKMEDD